MSCQQSSEEKLFLFRDKQNQHPDTIPPDSSYVHVSFSKVILLNSEKEKHRLQVTKPLSIRSVCHLHKSAVREI